jgi:uncharacterized protein
MNLRHETVDIAVDGRHVGGVTVIPEAAGDAAPAALFVHGWGGNREQYLARARVAAALGCICLTFDLRGHEHTPPQHATVTREDNLRDVVAAYDVLAHTRGVDPSRIAMVGSSYGAYLAAIATLVRPARWLSLRAPAIYKDGGWLLPKRELHQDPDFAEFRRRTHGPPDNRALDACAQFRGDALIVESQDDSIVPHAVVTNYLAAFTSAHSLTYRLLEGADHGLSRESWKQAYTDVLVAWLSEMIRAADADKPKADAVVTAIGPG